jgi:glycosyltransferase involved in cell wall biosynthesis
MDSNEVLKLKNRIAELEAQFAQAEEDLALQKSKTVDLQNDFHSTQAKLFEYFKHGHDLKKLCDVLKSELDGVYSSGRWKATQPFWSIKDKFSKKNQKNTRPVPKAESRPESATPFTVIKDKKNILVIDRSILRPDRDAGSLSLFEYCGLFSEMGLGVTFFGDDFGDLYAPDTQDYIERLNKSGINILFGESYYASFVEWLSKNADKFNYVLLNRPDVASKYLDTIKRNSKAKTIYLGCDLHFLREMRDFELTKDPSALERSVRFKDKERWIMHESDVVLMYSSTEADIIKNELGLKNVLVSPLYYFDDFSIQRKDFSQTENLLFVGGFPHKPNVDAVEWFLSDIWPKIKEKINGAKTVVVGSSPPADLLEKAGERIVFTDHLTSAELDALYQTSRLCIIPLRFGAGIKGKTLEAIHKGIPIVTTSIGIEGMPGLKEILTPADSGDEFASQIVEKYNNMDLCVHQTEECMDYLQKNYSRDNIINILKEVIKSHP